MQALAAWLIARPLNAVLALAATLPLQYLSFLSGAVLITLILRKGLRAATVDAVLAGALFVLIGMAVDMPPGLSLAMAMVVWLPAALLGVLLAATRSLTLTLQLTVILAVVAILGFEVMVPDPEAYWRPVVEFLLDTSARLGTLDRSTIGEEQIKLFTRHVSTVIVMAAWFNWSLACTLGYGLYRRTPDETEDFGRFRDLSFGRVIALVLAIASVAGFATGAAWLQSIALVMFLVFWLHGLAIVHWMHREGQLPVFGLVAIYVLMPVLNVILLMSLAVVGYVDAWFRLRRPGSAVN